MKYLVIGDSNSMHIFNFVKTFLLPQGFDVHLLTLSTRPIRDEFREFYRDNNVTVHSIAEKGYKRLDKTDKISRLLNLFLEERMLLWNTTETSLFSSSNKGKILHESGLFFLSHIPLHIAIFTAFPLKINSLSYISSQSSSPSNITSSHGKRYIPLSPSPLQHAPSHNPPQSIASGVTFSKSLYKYV